MKQGQKIFNQYGDGTSHRKNKLCPKAVKSVTITTQQSVNHNKKKLNKWSKLIRQRDGHCHFCGTIENLTAHHIQPVSTHPELAYDLSNGITLCDDHHGYVEVIRNVSKHRDPIKSTDRPLLHRQGGK